MRSALRTALLAIAAFPASRLDLAAAEKYAADPPGEIPVLCDVDVVVVGGSSAGVAAAAKAAEEGAKVFVAAPRPYLGEDLCGTYRLWLEPGEEPRTPLAKDLFAGGPAARSCTFSYSADRPSESPHRDSAAPSKLCDGKWSSAASESVQYGGDVAIALDLGRERRLRKIDAMVYQRTDDFEVAEIAVSASGDGKSWSPAALIRNGEIGQGAFEGPALVLSAPLGLAARHLKLEVRKGPRARRVLLGEIRIEPEPSDLERKESAEALVTATPLHAKTVLDRALLDAGVRFLYGSFAAEILRDEEGKPAGVVIANRSGRQAVRAKVIVDATPRASVARLAGASAGPYPTSPQTFRRVVVGGEPRSGEGIQGVRAIRTPVREKGRDRFSEALEYTLRLPAMDGTYASLERVEQLARDLTWTPGLADASEVLYQVPPDPVRGRKSLQGPFPGAEEIDLDAFRPDGVDRLYVLGGCADVPREAAEAMLRPLAMLDVGARIGRAAAAEAKGLPAPKGVRLPGAPARPTVPGEAREAKDPNPRPAGAPAVPAQRRDLPVLGEYDVVVVGGGTGGAPAAIAAGREGARTLLVEYLHGLGGVGTLGLIGSYYFGNRVGFTREIDEGVGAMGPASGAPKTGWNVEWKSEWYRRELRRAGVDVWFGALGAGAIVDGGRVRGVAVATPEGRGAVLAKVVVDSTGNSDIAAAAGATCTYVDGSHIAVQGSGLPPRGLGDSYRNTDYTFVDDSDVLDAWRALVIAKEKFQGEYDLGQLIDTRERRQIVGEFTITPIDIANLRTFPDTIVVARSNFDSHGYTVHPLFLIRPPDRESIDVNLPFRCLIPRGLEGILVTGLGVSAHRDAVPVIRMQPDIQNQGYAAGVAAAMLARSGKSVRELDVKALQRHLVEKGNLPERVLSDRDSFPLPPEAIARAAERVAKDYDGLEVLLADPERALPLLRKAYAAASQGPSKLAYAAILGMLGDPAGAGTLIDEVRSRGLDKGWNFTGMGQFGASLSPLDSIILALGRTKDPGALEPLLEKARLLDAGTEFSHHRAIAMALESLADPRAAAVLAEVLGRPGMSGHAVTDIGAALRSNPPSGTDTSTRNRALRELILARALYRCGDRDGLGEKILRQYAQDLHGHYSRHARAVLASPRPTDHQKRR